MASDRAKWGNYVHSYISGSQGVNITLFFFFSDVIVIVIVYFVFVSVVFFFCFFFFFFFFFFWGGGLCCVFVVILLFCFFCSTLCSSTVTIDVSVIHVRKYLLLEQHFNNLSIFFLSFLGLKKPNKPRK